MSLRISSAAHLLLLAACCLRAEEPAANAPGKSTPWKGKPHEIPGVIEAEHYDEGPEGVAYHDTTPKNSGVAYRGDTGVDIEGRPDASNLHGIGWTRAGEWLLYTVDVKDAGTYLIEFPVASKKKGGLFHIEFNSEDVTGPIQLPDTGAWTKLETLRKSGVKLKKGLQLMKLSLDTDGESNSIGDIDLLRFTRTGD